MNISGLIGREIWGGIRWQIALERRLENPIYLEQYGYKVYSQNDEDGIINEIFRRIGTANKQFIEFGVDRGLESNTHALLLQGFKGMWIEGREEAYSQIIRRFAPAIRQKQLVVKNGYVNRENVNEMLRHPELEQEIDLLSIDIDGNDWHVWKAVTELSPRVVIIEYNGKFAPEINWHMAYNRDHIWDRSDRQGASLKAMELLGLEKGYQLVGTNISGVNAFFVRRDLAGDLFPTPATAENLYNPFRMPAVHHLNGHPDRNFVGTDREGMEGVFEYYPDWNFIPSFGFYPVEVLQDGSRRFWMSEKNGRIFIKLPQEPIDDIRIDWINEEIEQDMLSLSFSVKGKKETVLIGGQRKGSVSFKIEPDQMESHIIPMEVEINQLSQATGIWTRGDARWKGAAINGITYGKSVE